MRVVFIAAALLVVVATYVWKTSDQSTRIVIYNPAGFDATEEVSGNCFTGSIAAQRAGAFRCMADNSIYDPSFVTNNNAVAAPVGDPDKNEGVLIKLTEPLLQPPEAWENPPDPANPKPWYVQLTGGGVCGVLTGTRPPDFPLGCTIPSVTESAYCMQPVPVAQRPTVYSTICGTYDESTRDIVNQKAYLIEEMWL
jgi:hypothetical protein